ncbi:hypothetical protein PoB_004259000 [Plakobranchus ocellatus]|uniref:Mutator-like transposase domain-containing protein n=1 Tax=Plakobranchus ocellatus TaxID=259542 RepID=A0AAV4B9A5_9GAST|nr:hypothetical protein PoB_004259000 [Plakobranchus ocellatus]
MEQKSVVELFGRSLQNGMGYRSMLSDGDTNIIKEIHKLDPYPGMKVEKLELINIWPSVSVRGFILSSATERSRVLL